MNNMDWLFFKCGLFTENQKAKKILKGKDEESFLASRVFLKQWQNEKLQSL